MTHSIPKRRSANRGQHHRDAELAREVIGVAAGPHLGDRGAAGRHHQRLTLDGAAAGRKMETLAALLDLRDRRRSEEHTSELQSLMRISYAVFCLNKKIH